MTGFAFGFAAAVAAAAAACFAVALAPEITDINAPAITDVPTERMPAAMAFTIVMPMSRQTCTACLPRAVSSR
jgi:hypothetical protein